MWYAVKYVKIHDQNSINGNTTIVAMDNCKLCACFITLS